MLECVGGHDPAANTEEFDKAFDEACAKVFGEAK